MECDSKRHKIEVDRISNLPSPLITHILSLLPTKYAVRTSSLSTFWKRQWTSITQLRFDDTLPPDTISTPETKSRFLDFVNWVLFTINLSCPDVFQLHCSQVYGAKQLCSWVYAALSRRFRHVDLSFPSVKYGYLSRRLFICKNLVVLKLKTGFFLEVPMLVSLDSLKILHLAVKLSDNDSFSRLVSGCPLLEELKIRGTLGLVNEVKISSLALKRLILIGFLNPRLAFECKSYELVLNTPSLQYIEQRDCFVPNSYSMEILRCLDRAHLDLVLDYFRLAFLTKPIIRAARLARMRHTLTSLAVGISHVKFLYLSKTTCKALCCSILCKLPKFPRLIELKMYETRWKLLRAFLENSPELASLSFRLEYKLADKPLVPSTWVPFCMLCNLKSIKINNFWGREMELDIVRYFLENSLCLNKLLIYYSSDIITEEKAEISKKVLMLPKASTSCVVLIT